MIDLVKTKSICMDLLTAPNYTPGRTDIFREGDYGWALKTIVSLINEREDEANGTDKK